MSLVIAVRYLQLGFDFYMSPTGDDVLGDGSLSRPWSITAFNSKGSTYTGKRVGLLPGVYQYGTSNGTQTSLYTLMQNSGGGTSGNAGSYAALNVNGGSAGSPTYVGSCNSQGNYSPRTAILYPADISTDARPAWFCAVIGQGYTAFLPNKGNVTIAGLTIHKWYQWGIGFYPGVAGTYPTPNNPGISVVDCEIYDGVGDGNNNSSPIVFQGCRGVYAGNNKLHDHIKSGTTGNDIAGIYSFSCYSNVYEFNTIYNTGMGIYDKNYPNGNHTYRYNFIECATGNAIPSPLYDATGGGSGDVLTIYNNILNAAGGPSPVFQYSGINPSMVQSIKFFNNTCIYNTNGSPGLYLQRAAGPLSQYNNVIVGQTTGTQGLITAAVTEYTAPCDYNVYDSSNHSPLMGHSPTPGTANPTIVGLSQWKTDMGLDVSSVSATPVFAGTLGVQVASNYKLTGSVGVGTSRVGGVSGGAAVDCGAWGNLPPGVTNIGCNF